ncbi:MAG: hypothetical protein ACRD0M_03550, partial [Acidimicrobiales bacterium]
RRGRVASADEVLRFWAARAGCGAWSEAAGGTEPARVTRLEAQGCRPGLSVVHLRVAGGGHEWFRPPLLDTTGVVGDFLGPALVERPAPS